MRNAKRFDPFICTAIGRKYILRFPKRMIGHIACAALEQKFWDRLTTLVGLEPRLRDDTGREADTGHEADAEHVDRAVRLDEASPAWEGYDGAAMASAYRRQRYPDAEPATAAAALIAAVAGTGLIHDARNQEVIAQQAEIVAEAKRSGTPFWSRPGLGSARDHALASLLALNASGSTRR